VCIDAAGVWLVVHLARGGWIKWRDRLPDQVARPGRSPLALRVGLEEATGFDVTEMGTEKRLALWVVGDPKEIEAVATLGADPLDPAFDVDALAHLLAGAPGTLKTALSSQSLIAGIGNAYSDEILHVARLSPFKPARHLTDDEVGRLHAAVVRVLGEALQRAVGQAASELKGDKKRAMRVHGRTGEPCPECGDRIREVWSATKSMQYCPTCQTGACRSCCAETRRRRHRCRSRPKGADVNDREIVEEISRLSDEEHRLEETHVGEGLSSEETEQLRTIEVALDQCWDLLRQRRARRSAGQDPDDAAVRPESVVERYWQ
jgi:formamidopyrimidine-DNA glycosylase